MCVCVCAYVCMVKLLCVYVKSAVCVCVCVCVCVVKLLCVCVYGKAAVCVCVCVDSLLEILNLYDTFTSLLKS